MSAQKVGFIGGGQMASALAGGAIRTGLLKPEHLVIAEPNAQQQTRLQETLGNVELVGAAKQVLAKCERIVLAVKPQVLRVIAPELSPDITPAHLLVSIAAGISLAQLQQSLGTRRVVRVMPNTPCQVAAGASGIAADNGTTAEDVAWVEQLFNSVGITVRVSDAQLHAVTAVSGSGPAYIYLVIEALSDAGVAQGLPREQATLLAAQTVLGSAQMVLTTGLHPGQLKDQVTSPGGTTIAALHHLEQSAVRGAFIEAVSQAARRSIELGS